MTKFKKSFKQMTEDNKELFSKFKKVHDNFEKDNQLFRKEFNKQGEHIVNIIRKYEDELCGRTEGTGFGMYSSKLAEKFWNEVRVLFSEIDQVGVE